VGSRVALVTGGGTGIGAATARRLAAGRSMAELEMIGGTRARFTGTDDVAGLDDAMRDFPDQVAAGYSTFCMKPSQHTDDVGEVEGLCRRMVAHLERLESERAD